MGGEGGARHPFCWLAKLTFGCLGYTQVEYTGYSSFNSQRFGQQFVGRVANPKDILLFYRRRIPHKPAAEVAGEGAVAAHRHRPQPLPTDTVEDLIAEYLGRQDLRMLNDGGIAKAVKNFVDKDVKESIKEYVIWSLETAQETLKKRHDITCEEDVVDRAREVTMTDWILLILGRGRKRKCRLVGDEATS